MGYCVVTNDGQDPRYLGSILFSPPPFNYQLAEGELFRYGDDIHQASLRRPLRTQLAGARQAEIDSAVMAAKAPLETAMELLIERILELSPAETIEEIRAILNDDGPTDVIVNQLFDSDEPTPGPYPYEGTFG